MQAEILTGGFADPAPDAARAFRTAMNAMARPGQIYDLALAAPPAPLSPAAGTLLLTLVDATTPLFLVPAFDTPALRGWIAFHCGAPIVPPEQAEFALGPWEALPHGRMPKGTPDYPDRSVTLIVDLPPTLAPAAAPANAQLSGPGIEVTNDAYLPDLPSLIANHAQGPLGFDCFFCAGGQVWALPRSTQIKAL